MKGGVLNKRRLHHVLVILRQVRLWHLLLVLVIMGVLSALLLRQNNLNMITLRNLVQQADEQDGDVQHALTNLHGYISTHMNTGMGEQGIFLEHSYQRAYDQAVQKAVDNGAASSRVYQQADKDCQPQFSRTASFTAYIQCVIDKVAASGSAVDPVRDIQAPPADLYRYNFVSPVWSPDTAGWFVLATMMLVLVIVFMLISELIIYALLRHRHRHSDLLQR